MVWLIVLGVIVGIIALIMLIPVGADVGYENGELSVSAKVCGVMLKLLPRKPADESKPRKEKKLKKEKKPKEPGPDQAAKPKKKLNLQLNRDEILALAKAVLRGVGKFGKLTVDRFMLHYVAAGSDPYATAMTYNYVNAALSSLAPICAERFIVKDCDVWTNIDFTGEKTRIDFGLCVVIRIGQVFRMAFAILFGALWILIKNKFRLLKEKNKNRGSGNEVSPEGQPEEAYTENVTEENIQEEERMDSNG